MVRISDGSGMAETLRKRGRERLTFRKKPLASVMKGAYWILKPFPTKLVEYVVESSAAENAINNF